MRTILTTVGTSLLTNAEKYFKRSIQDLGDAEIANYLRISKPEEASAETNSLSRILREGDHIVFIHSDTRDGERCANLLRNHYRNRNFTAEIKKIPELNYEESRFKMRGLRSLVSTIIDVINEQKQKGNEILINATGGFKAEIAYSVLIGLIFDIPVVYIHERFRDIIEMPAMPISWDYTLFIENEDFFKWISNNLYQTEEVEKRLKGRPRELRMLLTEEEGLSFLSPAGQAFYWAFKIKAETTRRTPIFLSNKARQAYSRMPQENKTEVDTYLRKLLYPEWRRSNARAIEPQECFVIPQGHKNLRIIYVEEEERLKVLEILTHDEYMLLRKQGIKLESYKDFEIIYLECDNYDR